MASGKSLELAKIKSTKKRLCICGGIWEDHFRKDGSPMVKFGGPEWKDFFAAGHNLAGQKGQKPFTRT